MAIHRLVHNPGSVAERTVDMADMLLAAGANLAPVLKVIRCCTSSVQKTTWDG